MLFIKTLISLIFCYYVLLWLDRLVFSLINSLNSAEESQSLSYIQYSVLENQAQSLVFRSEAATHTIQLHKSGYSADSGLVL